MSSPADSEPAPRSSGEVLAKRYRLLTPIGEGGMGVVWSAEHALTGKRVAVKLLATLRPDVKRRFIREAKVVAALRHRNIVQVHDVLETHDGTPAMVMDLLEGETLEQRLDALGRVGLEEAVGILVPVVDAIDHAHQCGIVHRDVKPDNIFLAEEPDGEIAVKVLDFGIAKVTAPTGAIEHSVDITRTGSVLGTPTYMAPEQVYGEKDIDARADVWALGIVLYESLTGICPTDASNVGQVFKAIVTRGFPPLREAAPEAPVTLHDLCDRMLSIAPEERPSLAEIRRTLKASVAGDHTVPPPAPVAIRVPRSPGAETLDAPSHDAHTIDAPLSSAGTLGPTDVSPRARRSRGALAAAAVVTLVAAAAWGVSRDDGGEQTSPATPAPEPAADPPMLAAGSAQAPPETVIEPATPPASEAAPSPSNRARPTPSTQAASPRTAPARTAPARTAPTQAKPARVVPAPAKVAAPPAAKPQGVHEISPY